MVNNMSEKNKRASDALRQLADKIEKDSVTIRSSNLRMSAGHVSGVDPENYAFETNHHDGNFDVEIQISYYDEDRDDSGDAYDPIDEIRKEAGY